MSRCGVVLIFLAGVADMFDQQAAIPNDYQRRVGLGGQQTGFLRGAAQGCLDRTDVFIFGLI